VVFSRRDVDNCPDPLVEAVTANRYRLAPEIGCCPPWTSPFSGTTFGVGGFGCDPDSLLATGATAQPVARTSSKTEALNAVRK
jgi:hypothetical protein